MKTTNDKVMAILGVLLMIVIIGTAVGIPSNVIDSILQWGISIIVGILLSGLVGELVEAVTGDWLKNLFLVVPIGKFKFSISLFTIAVVLLKAFLFH